MGRLGRPRSAFPGDATLKVLLSVHSCKTTSLQAYWALSRLLCDCDRCRLDVDLVSAKTELVLLLRHSGFFHLLPCTWRHYRCKLGIVECCQSLLSDGLWTVPCMVVCRKYRYWLCSPLGADRPKGLIVAFVRRVLKDTSSYK